MTRRNPVLHRVDVALVAAFAVVFLRAGWLVRAVGPLFVAYLRLGLPGGPNALLTTRGRSSGLARTVPLAPLEADGRLFVQAAFGDVGWARNVRAWPQAILTRGGHARAYDVREVPAEEIAAIHQRVLAGNPGSGFLLRLLGPTVRPPAGILAYFHLRLDETPEQYRADARARPVFELLPLRRNGVPIGEASPPTRPGPRSRAADRRNSRS